MRIDFARKRIQAKLTFYGAPEAGKLTLLSTLAKLLPGNVRAPFIATEGDQVRACNLWVGHAPLQPGAGLEHLHVHAWATTASGRVFRDGSWTSALFDSDGVLFVVDSTPAGLKAAHEAQARLDRLWASDPLRQRPRPPLVFAWTKRDLDQALPVEALEETLNGEGHPSVTIEADGGASVLQCWKTVMRAPLASFYALSPEVFRGHSPEG